MKTPHILLAVNAALAVLVAVPVMSAIRTPEGQAGPGWTVQEGASRPEDRPVLVDDDDEHEGWIWWGLWDDGHRRDRHHDEDDDDEDDDDEDEDDDEGRATGVNPAPAGTVAPPANGLFGDGAPPRVQVN
jgi:hypothetical protein